MLYEAKCDAHIKKPPGWAVNFIYLYFYIACCAGEEFVEKYFVKSYRLAPVLSNIFAILFVEGQRGCPYLDHRLLLLKVVASNPLRIANPEQDTLCSFANESIANQTSACVILKLLVSFVVGHEGIID